MCMENGVRPAMAGSEYCAAHQQTSGDGVPGNCDVGLSMMAAASNRPGQDTYVDDESGEGGSWSGWETNMEQAMCKDQARGDTPPEIQRPQKKCCRRRLPINLIPHRQDR